MIAIVKKEMRTYFTSIIGYILLAGFVFFNAFYFSIYNVFYMYPDYSMVLEATTIIFLIMIPILTMRLFSEEAKQKTDQLLYTSPLKVEQIVGGKLLSAILFLLIGMLITAIFPIALRSYGELPTAKIVASFIGYMLLGTCFISVGIFISALTDNQIVAAFMSFAALFFIYMLDGLSTLAPTSTGFSIGFICALVLLLCYVVYDATRNIFAGIIIGVIGLVCVAVLAVVNPLIFDGVIVKALGWLSLSSRFGNFTLGILNVSDIVYYLTFIVLFWYLTVNIIEKRRWK